MTETSGFARLGRVRGELVVFALALLVRGVHLLQVRSAPIYGLYMGDARIFDRWARGIAGGDWIGTEVFYQAPLYPYLLGTLYSLFGDSTTVVLGVQAILGAAACSLLMVAGTRFFGSRVGLVAGVGLALYPPAIFFDGIVQKTSLGLFLLCASLAVAGGLDRRLSWRGVLGLGILTGLLALVRENALVLSVPWLLWLAARPVPGSAVRRVVAPALFAVGFSLALAPVGLRNLAVSGDLYLTTSNFGHNLYMGNNPDADGLYLEIAVARGNPLHESEDATAQAEAALGRTLTPAEVSRYWTSRAVTWALEEPLDWAALLLRKAMLVVHAKEPGDTEDQVTYARWSALLRWLSPVFHFGVLAPLALLGLWMRARDWRRLWILVLLPGLYTAGLVLFFVFARFRLPLVPFALLFAAVAVCEGPAWWRRVGVRQRSAALLLSLGVAVVANWPLTLRSDATALADYNIGTTLLEAGRLEEAIPHLRAAVAGDARSAPAHYNLGRALLRRGELDEAVHQLSLAARLGPDVAAVRAGVAESARILHALGNSRAAEGRRSEAQQLQRAALDLASAAGDQDLVARARAALRGR